MNSSRITNSTVSSSAVGERSTAITINNLHGPSITEIVKLFGTLLDQSYPRLVEDASTEAARRVERFASTFTRVATEQEITQEQLGRFAEPDVQFVLSSAIHGSARRDSKEQHELLARLILQRLQAPEGDLWGLVLNEAVTVAGKLSSNHLRMLALAFVFKHTNWCVGPSDWNSCNEFLNKTVTPLLGVQPFDGDLLHLEYTGCGTINRAARPSFELFVSDRFGPLFAGVPRNSAALISFIDRESKILTQLRKAVAETKFDTLILTTVGLALGSTVVEQLSGTRVPIEYWISESGINLGGTFVYSSGSFYD